MTGPDFPPLPPPPGADVDDRDGVDEEVEVEVQDERGAPVPGAAVAVGGLLLETDARGRARFARTEPGPIAVRVIDPRVDAGAILLDSTRGAVVSGPAGR